MSKELRTGIIAVAAIALFIWGFNFLKGSNLFNSSRSFYVEYDNVQGLAESAPVTIEGLRVGSITSIEFHPQKRGILVVKFALENKIQFSKKSIAEIYSPDFISGKSIKIITSMEGEIAKDNDTLVGNIEAGILGAINDQIAPLQIKVDSFLTNANSLLDGFNKVFNEEGQKDLSESLTKLNSTLGTFRSASSSLNKYLAEDGKLDTILTSASMAAKNLVSLTDSLNQANLKQTVNQLEGTLQRFDNILAQVENGDGSIGKLLKDEGLYVNLENAAKEMEELLRELKENPKRFVHFSLFGKKAKVYEPQEEEK